MVFPYIISVGLIDPMSPTDQGDIRKLLKHDLECFNSDFCEKGKSDKCMGMLAERLDDFFCSREPECHEINLGKCTKDSGDQRDTDCVFGLVPIGARGNLVVTYAAASGYCGARRCTFGNLFVTVSGGLAIRKQTLRN